MAIREEIEKIFLEIDNFFRSSEDRQKQNKRLAYQWIYSKVNDLYNIQEPRSSFDFKITKGFFYLFNYSSKLFNKNKLDHYDAFPLIFVFDVNKSKGYFSAINFHWINMKYRSIILKKIIAAFPESFLNDEILRPISYDKFKAILGNNINKYINYAIRNYRYEQIQNFKGIKVLRINNTEMTDAIKYVSPEYIGISYSQVFQKIKESNFNLKR
jgi:hypothetical protein